MPGPAAVCFGSIELVAVPMCEFDVFRFVFADRLGVRDVGELLGDDDDVSASAVLRYKRIDLTGGIDKAALVVLSAAVLAARQAIDGIAVVEFAADHGKLIIAVRQRAVVFAFRFRERSLQTGVDGGKYRGRY